MQLYVKVVKSLPKHRTKDSESQRCQQKNNDIHPPVRSHRCSPHPCVPSTPGLEAVITNFASQQIQPCDHLVHAQSISQDLNQKKWSVRRLPNSSLDPKKGAMQSGICLQQVLKPNLHNLKLRCPRALQEGLLDKSLQIKNSQ